MSDRVGPLMSYWVLTREGQVLSRTSVQRVTNLELNTDENIMRCNEFSASIAEKVGDVMHFVDDDKAQPSDWVNERDYDEEFDEEFRNVVCDPKVPEADVAFTPDMYNNTYLNMELALPRGGGEVEFARVVKRMRDKDGLPIGTANDNPILDSRVYEVEYPDGHRASLAANVIAVNLFSQVDHEGNRLALLDDIVHYQTNGKQVNIDDGYVIASTGTKRKKETTIGWELMIQWKNGSTTWVPLKDTKEAYPVQIAEYAIAAGISQEPAFSWWVPFTMKKRKQIISNVKSKYWIRTHKFGIKIPKNAEEAKAFDLENGDTKWWDSIWKEMTNVHPAFEVWDKPVAEIPIGYQEVRCP